jgi:predicted methyltransferase
MRRRTARLQHGKSAVRAEAADGIVRAVRAILPRAHHEEEPMNTSGLSALRAALAATAACVVSACAMAPGAQAPATLTEAQISAIVNSPDRTTADRDNDKRRKPEQILGFIGLRPGMVALDVVAGGGYTTELLARAVGPTGKVFGQAQPRDPSRPAPAGARPPGAGVLDREARLSAAKAPAAPIALVLQRLVDPVPPELAQGKLDVVTLMFNYHDLGALGEGRAQMNRAIFAALKPGGIYIVADHSGRPGTGISESTTLHRIDEAFLRSEVEAAGFKQTASGSFLRNPADPRDKETPEPTMPKDEFILKFVKPASTGG